MKLLYEQLSALRDYAGAEIGSPFSDRSSPTFSAALWQFIKIWAMFGAVPNGQCIQTHVQYQKLANSEGFHTSLCFRNTDTTFVLPLATCCRSHWPRGLRRRSAAARLLRSWVRIPPGAWIFVCCECRVLSGRGLCDELITRPDESYRLCYVAVCDLETSRMGAPYIYI